MGKKSKPDACFLCGRYGPTEKHHLIHGSGRRQLAEEDGLYVYLCPSCHTLGPRAVHNNPKVDRMLQAYGQKMWKENTGGTDEDFIRRYGKSYAEEATE